IVLFLSLLFINCRYTITFIKANGDRITTKGKEGESLLDLVVNNDLDFDGFGACEGTLTCSTCHCILKQDVFDKIPNPPNTEENDMLDLAFGVTDTSRLGCQIRLSKDLDGTEVTLPATVNDARASQ
ncbi:adrenodoxin-like protein 2, mitochondrial, partial [Homalodisca vitripennis]|uniref:adrenodoxin-like protein 2, mitochondrial n=1 Tax=Homalodisca vitripennis TaxID=197043 RepID=UPI001EEC0332